ncbi:MAG: hypothetical protein KJ573_09735 [Proteobacteria bacterium]|nr:hypothetical protein [Pseudomonadota bacterium]MBU1903856.1 hypothetical protein [Pseudomonadota bacterium]
MEPNKVAVVIRDPNNYWEGLRSSLGLGLEMIQTDMFVIGEVNMPEERVEGYKDNLGFLKDELEGNYYSDEKANIEKWGFFEYMSLDDMAKKLQEYDLVMPF